VAQVRVMYYINQFFAGIGGEEKADVQLDYHNGPLGPGNRLQVLLEDAAEIVVTVHCGDNYFSEHRDEVLASILEISNDYNVKIVIAGPAFLAGRYGFACVEVCHFLSTAVDLYCVTGMSADNPAVLGYKQYKDKRVFLFPTSDTTAGMDDALRTMASFVSKLAAGVERGLASEEGYIPRGIRVPSVANKSGAQRSIDTLLRKIAGYSVDTEIAFEISEIVPAAPPLVNLKHAHIALISTAGVHTAGNPYGFKALSNTQWRKYFVGDLNSMQDGRWCVIHGGTSTMFMSDNPNYAVPLDVCRELEKEGMFASLYSNFYGTTGVAASVPAMQAIGREIVGDMKAEGVNGALLVST